jgi:hypothetical protein
MHTSNGGESMHVTYVRMIAGALMHLELCCCCVRQDSHATACMPGRMPGASTLVYCEHVRGAAAPVHQTTTGNSVVSTPDLQDFVNLQQMCFECALLVPTLCCSYRCEHIKHLWQTGVYTIVLLADKVPN